MTAQFELADPPASPPTVFGYDADADALFELPADLQPVLPKRSAVHDYLLNLHGLFDDYSFWSLAPVDERVRTRYCDQHRINPGITEFVWLIDFNYTCTHGSHLSWALVSIPDRRILAMRPKPSRPMRDELHCLYRHHLDAAA